MQYHIPLTIAQNGGSPFGGPTPFGPPKGLPDAAPAPGSNGTTAAGGSGVTGETTEQPAYAQNLPPSGQQSSQGKEGGGLGLFIPLALMMGVFFFILMGGQRKEKKKRAKLLASIKKGDKVQTVGGILGTIVELRETEVLLKVDENANTRIKFARSSIQSLLSERQQE